MPSGLPSTEYTQHLKGDDDPTAQSLAIKNPPPKLAMYLLTDEPGYGPRTAYNGYSGYSGDV